jgi:transposase
MEEKKDLGHEPDQAVKAHLVRLMQMGYSWQEAKAQTGLQVSRSTAYRLVQAVQTRGEAAILDGRHGHPAKLRDVVLQWLRAFCHTAPQTPSREVQATLQEQFGIQVSIGHLNRVRARLGIGSCRIGRSKKNSNQHVPQRNLSGKRELGHYCLLLRHMKRDCWRPSSKHFPLVCPMLPHALLTSPLHRVRASCRPCFSLGWLDSHVPGTYAATQVTLSVY